MTMARRAKYTTPWMEEVGLRLERQPREVFCNMNQKVAPSHPCDRDIRTSLYIKTTPKFTCPYIFCGDTLAAQNDLAVGPKRIHALRPSNRRPAYLRAVLSACSASK